MISFIETRYLVKLEDHELVPENLDSIESLAGFIERKLALAQEKSYAG